MEGREPLFFDEEATVDDLAKGYFQDKTLIDKKLFKISKGEQKGLKPRQKAVERKIFILVILA